MAGAGLCAGFEAWKCDSRGRRRVARCDGGDISWQAQYFVLPVRRVDAERLVAGAGNREVVSGGGGECRFHIGIGV